MNAGIGHNGVSKEELRSIVERVERLNEKKAALQSDLQSDITEIYAEAKANGFDPKIIRQVVRIRKQARYMQALGMLADTPLGQAALGR